MTVPTPSIGSLLTKLTREPGRPRITWYGPDSERVELSGAVLENWVNKTTNLLVEEFDAGPGTRVLLDLPGHWRTVVWALAVWRVGACVVLEGPQRAAVDVVVTTRPQCHAGATDLVAVALPALARLYDGDLPAGAIDAAAAVMTYGDAVGWTPAIEDSAPALVAGSGPAVTHAGLLDASRSPRPSARSRAMLTAPTALGSSNAVLAVLGLLAGDGSVVLVDPTTLARWQAEEKLDHVLKSEGATLAPPTF